MHSDNTALLMIGYQNDYFAEDGILRGVIEQSAKTTNALNNTLELLRSLENTSIPIIHTPIIFTDDYSELVEPVGILAAIRDAKAFRLGSSGSDTIDQVKAFGSRVLEIPGKRGLNAFSNTHLESSLISMGIRNLVLAGAVTSICIDSTARSAFELGFNVSILSDCTCGRTDMEQEFFCSQIFPLYAQVIDSETFLQSLDL